MTGASGLGLEPIAEIAAGPPAVALSARVPTPTASAPGLPARSIDAATAGQSFPWFDDEPSRRAIPRVLRAASRVAPVWNRRELSYPLRPHIDPLPERHRHGDRAVL